MMTKILHISKFYYPYAGGIEDVCYNIVNIVKTNAELDQKVFCFNDINKTVREKYQDIDVTRVAVWRTYASQPLSAVFGKELKKLLHSYCPDVVHFHAPNPLGSHFLLKHLPKQTKLIVHWHSDIFAQQFIYQIVRSEETRMLQRADTIIATSQRYLDYSAPLRPFADKVVVIPNIICAKKFELNDCRLNQIQEIKQEYGNKPIVLFVGRHTAYKGLKHLIEAAQLIKNDCAIVIGGKGELTEELKAGNLSDKVHFIGRIDDDQLAAYYHAADVFAFPSVTKNEAFGVVLAEAMYCRAVPVTFHIEGSGVNWVNLDTETGIEVENRNSEKFAQAVDRLLEDEQLRTMLANNAHQRIINQFLIESIAKEVIQLYGAVPDFV